MFYFNFKNVCRTQSVLIKQADALPEVGAVVVVAAKYKSYFNQSIHRNFSVCINIIDSFGKII